MYQGLNLIIGNIFKAAVVVVSIFCLVFVFSYNLMAQDQNSVKLGEETFKSKGCIACHTIGKGKLSGPDLLGVTERREEEWLKKWLKSPDTMVLTDPIAKEMLKEFFVPMPNQNLSDEQIVYLIEYFKYEDNKNNKN